MSIDVPAAYTLASYLPEVHEPQHGAGHEHAREDVQGYIVCRTDWSGDGPTTREPVAFYVVEPAFRSGEATYTRAYGEALERVATERRAAGPSQYAVIDTVYDCGCHFIG